MKTSHNQTPPLNEHDHKRHTQPTRGHEPNAQETQRHTNSRATQATAKAAPPQPTQEGTEAAQRQATPIYTAAKRLHKHANPHNQNSRHKGAHATDARTESARPSATPGTATETPIQFTE